MNKTVIGIGELLWDVFAEGKRLGGAPVNFACHCGQLGTKAMAISRVGHDAPGEEILQAMTKLNMDVRHISIDKNHPTGTVHVTLSDGGKPSYTVCENVAWDHIPVRQELETLAAETDAVCFGSLGQRNEESRATIQTFLKNMRPETLKIFDINLRQSFYTDEIISQSLELCNVLKLSDEELPVIARQFNLTGTTGEQLSTLMEHFDIQQLAYTRGANGSLLISQAEISDHPGETGSVVSTVGAGDSFTATLCVGLLKEMPLNKINAWANRVAAFVVSQTGATPNLPKKLITGKELKNA